MEGLTQPTLLLKPFAESGDRNNIPETPNVTYPQRADLTNGFPEITGKTPEQGGLPPERKDFNALGYLTTTYDFFYQAGGTFTFDSTISTAIGGYPLNARLWYTDSNGATTILRSTKNNNTDNFVNTPSYIGTSWVQEIPVLGWNNVWTAGNTFNGSVSLGSSATVETPAISDNSKKVINSEWVKNNIGGSGFISGIPDYDSMYTIERTFTPEQNGIMMVYKSSTYPGAGIRLNNSSGQYIVCSESRDADSGVACVWAVVKAGSTYYAWSRTGTPTVYFIPFL